MYHPFKDILSDFNGHKKQNTKKIGTPKNWYT